MNVLPETDGSARQPDLAGRTLVAVCTYNEAANIGEVLRRIRRALPGADLLVVDDASPDGTSQIVREFAAADAGVTLIERRGERGLGGAIRRAVEHAIAGNYEAFLNLDADLSHPPEQLPELLRRAQEGTDVVVGSRYVPGGKIEGWSVRRRIMSRMVNRFATACLRLPVKDCSGSMRCYRVEALRRLDRAALRNTGYALLEELLVRLHQQGASMAEVPITFTDRAEGSSKLTLREAFRSVWQIIRLSWS